jgi:hypothetical protein
MVCEEGGGTERRKDVARTADRPERRRVGPAAEDPDEILARREGAWPGHDGRDFARGLRLVRCGGAAQTIGRFTG